MPSADEILQRMKALQERREEAAGPLVEILAKRSKLLEQLAELDEPYGKAYVAAEAGGWTTEELAEIGAEEPVKRPRKRSRSAGKRTGGQASGAADAGGSPTGSIPAQESSATTAETASSASV